MNLRHVVVLTKNKVFLYDLAGMIFIHRLNLEFHLGRVILSANISNERPLLFYSNSANSGTLKVFNIQEKKIDKVIKCHNSTILHFDCDLDGDYIATYSSNGDTLRLWNVNTGNKVGSYAMPGGFEI